MKTREEKIQIIAKHFGHKVEDYKETADSTLDYLMDIIKWGSN